MKTDSFFYWFFSNFRQAFFTLIGEDEQKAKSYEFKSIEVKEQSFRFDGVFKPEKSDDHLYFVEVHFRSDPDLYSGLFAEICLYLRQYKPVNDWCAVVLFPKESFDPGLHPHYREFFESGRLKRIYLTKLPPEYFEHFPLSLLRVITESDQELPSAIKKIAQQLPNEISDIKVREKIVDLLAGFLMNRLTSLSREEIEKMFEFKLLDMFPNIKNSRAYQEIAQEAAYENKRKIALAMIKEKMNPALISKLTGLSQKEVLAIGKNLGKPAKSRDRKAS